MAALYGGSRARDFLKERAREGCFTNGSTRWGRPRYIKRTESARKAGQRCTVRAYNHASVIVPVR
jgi:hypothetical protein